MKIIRKNVFETNSSSTHSISISKFNDYILPKEINFTFGEFGWEFSKYTSSFDKASYLYTIIHYFNGHYTGVPNKYDEFMNKIKKYLDEDGIKYTFQEFSGGYCKGYVDHGGDDGALEFIEAVLKDKEHLLRYLFSDNSEIHTGNDNEHDFEDIEICNENAEIYYKGN